MPSSLKIAGVMIAGWLTDKDAKKVYPQGWKAPRPDIRIVPQPKT
jgi:thioredoxin-dependent peroxiredoxin